APGALVLCALLGQDQATLLVLLLEDQRLDPIADGDHLGRVNVVLDGQLPRGDHALGLVADVEQDLVPVDLDDGALDDVAVIEVLDGLIDRGEERLLGAEVVDGYLGFARGGLDAARHVDCCSERTIDLATMEPAGGMPTYARQPTADTPPATMKCHR